MTAKWRNCSNEVLYILIFITITLVSKLNIDNIFFDIAANISFILLSLWYVGKSPIISLEKIFFQIVNGLWSSIIILLAVASVYCLVFNLYWKIGFNKTISIAFILFQILVAISEELIYRECFYKIFSHILPNSILVTILISFLFGLWHFYLHYSYTQLVSSFVLSLIIFIFKFKIKNFTLLSCILAHFIYNILCYFLVFS